MILPSWLFAVWGLDIMGPHMWRELLAMIEEKRKAIMARIAKCLNLSFLRKKSREPLMDHMWRELLAMMAFLFSSINDFGNSLRVTSWPWLKSLKKGR
jgi:hypothetical protein